MKAIVYAQYGAPEVLELKEVEKPKPKPHEVLIKIFATVAAPPDCQMRRGDSLASRLILGLRRPRKKILGLDFSGVVESVGPGVTRFKKGEAVYGFAGTHFGAYAEYLCQPEKGSLALKPSNLSHEEAASAVDGATTAWFFLKDKAGLQSGQSVLINGASGGMGVFAVQIARHLGARVTAVCGGANLDLVKSLGADEVMDYAREDFTKSNRSWDVVFDVAGKSSFAQCRRVLKPQGTYLVTVIGLSALWQTFWTRWTRGPRVIFALSLGKREALEILGKLFEQGSIKTVVDRVFPLEQIADAHRYVEGAHKKGKTVITVRA